MFALKPFERTPALLPRAETPFGLLDEFPTLFGRLFPWPALETPEWPYRYALTMQEKEKEVVMRAELPGFAPEEVKLEVKGDELTIEAEHKVPAEKEGEPDKEYMHVKRVVTLPADLELEKAEAIYRNGVLEVRLPRKPEPVVEGRKIEVKT